jgi:hypothetical protein
METNKKGNRFGLGEFTWAGNNSRSGDGIQETIAVPPQDAGARVVGSWSPGAGAAAAAWRKWGGGMV